MRPYSPIAIADLENHVKKIRSLSGCFRIVRTVEQQDLGADESVRAVSVITLLLQKLKEISGVEPDAILELTTEHRRLLRCFGMIYVFRSGQYTIGGTNILQGEQDARKAMGIADKLGDTLLKRLTLNHLGNSLLSQQRLEDGRDCFLQSVKLGRSQPIDDTFASALYNLARAETALGNYLDALSYVDEALALYRTTSSSSLPPFGQALLYGIRKNIHSHLQLPGEALKDALHSLSLLKNLGVTSRLPSAHHGLVESYLDIGDVTEAMHHATMALSEASRTGNNRDEITAQLGLCYVYQRLDDLVKAKHHAKNALLYARKGRNVVMESAVLQQLAAIAQRSGKLRTASKLLKEALATERHAAKKAALYRKLAEISFMEEKFPEAKEYLENGLTILDRSKTNKNRWEFQLLRARIARAEGQINTAKELCQAILQMPDTSDTTRLYTNLELSEIYDEQGEHKHAFRHFHTYHILQIAEERRRAENKLIALRGKHEIDEQQLQMREVQQQHRRTEQKLQQLVLEASERQRLIERTVKDLRTTASLLSEHETNGVHDSITTIIHRLQKNSPLNKQFLQLLHNIDESFFARLRAEYPGLTNGQERLCGLLRSGLSSSEIAELLHVSSDTVATQRKRLRQRMKLQRHEKLEKILAEI